MHPERHRRRPAGHATKTGDRRPGRPRRRGHDRGPAVHRHGEQHDHAGDRRQRRERRRPATSAAPARPATAAATRARAATTSAGRRRRRRSASRGRRRRSGRRRATEQRADEQRRAGSSDVDDPVARRPPRRRVAASAASPSSTAGSSHGCSPDPAGRSRRGTVRPTGDAAGHPTKVDGTAVDQGRRRIDPSADARGAAPAPAGWSA